MEKTENIIDYGSITVPKSWDEIALKKYQEIERYYDGKDDENFNVIDVLDILIDKDRDFIMSLPTEFLEKIMEHLVFLQKSPEYGEPTNKITIDGEEYKINFQNQLKTGEFIAAETLLKSDKHNYSALLAILCRKEGEIYDSKFENEVLEDRIALFEKLPITNVMPLVSFFLQLWALSEIPTQLSSQVEEAISLIQKDIETSQKNGDMSKRSMKSAMKTLQKLKQSISSI